MTSVTDEEITFVCPECNESLIVNLSMKDALIENGCVICLAKLSTDAFSINHQ